MRDDTPSSELQHPYASFLKDVAKPGRYLGGEHGQRPKDWRSVQCKICLAFPDVYDIGMSHLGYRILYKLLNDHEALLAERCYAPWIDMQQKLIDHGELLRSLESSRPLSDFDVVGFSLQYELTYTNVLSMLQLSGIPLRGEHRSDGDPLIIAGGPVATHAEPIAPFIDAFVIGDAEELASEVALSWAQSGQEGQTRSQRLRQLAQLPGVYVPSLYVETIDADSGLGVIQPRADDAPLPVVRRLVEDLSKFPFPDDGPVGGPEAIFDRVSIEVARGCTEGCRFCQAGMIYRPVRERPPEEVVDTVLRALEKGGHDEVSLTALSTADVSCISPLIRTLAEKTAPERVSISVASLRAYGLADDLLDEMRRVRAGGLTFAPEAGTQRMRDVINKNVTEEQLLETAERVFSKGFDNMKLYFIIGLPTEEDDDVLGILRVAENALGVAKRLGRQRARITVSVSTHVPKPHTPFQWCALDSLEEIQRKQSLLRTALGKNRRIQLRFHDSHTSRLEGVFARGDRRLAATLEHAFLAGARFDSWEEQLEPELWREAFRATDIDPDHYLGTLPTRSGLPWGHFDVGLESGFLAREYRKALRSRLSPPCGKVAGTFIHHDNVQDAEADQRRLVCYDCGIACDMTRMRSLRLDFLNRMGASEPPTARRLQLVGDPIPENAPNFRPEQLRPVRPGTARVRIRMGYEKLGPSALLGHLDFARELSRVIRRAGLRIAYSEGFRPKPRITFGPALALGVASLDEKIEVELIDPPESEPMLTALNAASGVGLRFVSARVCTEGMTRLGADLRAARYILAFAAEAGVATQQIEAKIREFSSRDKVIVKREIKGLGRLIDVKARVLSLRVGDTTTWQRIARAGLVGQLSALEVEVSHGPEGSLKPAEVVEAVLGDATLPHQAIRDALLLRHAGELPAKPPVTEQGLENPTAHAAGTPA